MYAPALDLGYTAASVIDDYPPLMWWQAKQTWTPRSYDSTYRGLITTREAVEGSVNMVAVKLLDMIGITPAAICRGWHQQHGGHWPQSDFGCLA